MLVYAPLQADFNWFRALGPTTFTPHGRYLSMFALFGRHLSSREKFIQSIRLNARLELLMKPVEQMSSMATLDFTPSLPDGQRALPLRLQAVALFLEEDIGQHGQGPETHDG